MKLKQISKRTLSVVLALLMIFSTMIVGTFTASGISVGVWIVSTSSSDGWGGYDTEAHQLIFNNETQLWENTYTATTDATVNVYIKNQPEGQSLIEYSISGTFDGSQSTATYSLTNGYGSQLSLKLEAGNTYKFTAPYGFETFTVTKDNGSSGGTVVTDQNLIDVLNKDKVMFYGCEPSSWSDTTFYVKDTSGNSVASATFSGSTTTTFNGRTSAAKYVAFCLPAATYRLGYSSSPMTAEVEAGSAYVVRGSTSASGFVQKGNDGSNYLYAFNEIATLTATTSCDASIEQGTELTASTSSSAGYSSVYLQNSLKYYIKNNASGEYTEVSISGGTIDTTTLEAGDYTLKTVLYDGNISVLADEDSFSVTSGVTTYNVSAVANPTEGGTASVSASSVTAGESVTVTAAAKTGYTFSGWKSDNGDFADATAAETTFTPTADNAVAEALFTANTYNINYGTYTNGSVTGPSTAQYGDTVTLTVTPDEGFILQSISTGTTATVNTSDYTFTMPASDVTISATFAEKPAVEYYLVGTINGSHYMESYAENNPPSATEGYNTLSDYKFVDGKLTLTITSTSYVFVSTGEKVLYTTEGWNGTTHPQTLYTNPTSANKMQVDAGTYTFTISDITDSSLVLDYAVPTTSHSVNVTAGDNGTASASPTTVNEGSGYTVTVTPNSGYEVDTFTVNGTDKKSSLSASGNAFIYQATMGTSDVTVNVTFKEKVSEAKTFYVAGRFGVKDSSGSETYTGSSSTDWTTNSTKIPFTRVGTSDIYKLETGYTISELSAKTDWYFGIYDGTTYHGYGTSGNKTLTASDAGTKFATAETSSSNFRFSDSSSTSTDLVVLYVDAAESSPKLYFALEAGTPVTPKISVTMTQGVQLSGSSSALRGNSGLEDVVATTDYTKTYDVGSTVTFRTQILDDYKFTDADGNEHHKFAVQGYSILMTDSDGNKIVASTRDISHITGGIYTAAYTFPENIVSATVTPVFTVSDSYAAYKDISFTTLYLKYEPGTGAFATYEPRYYTWRAQGTDEEVTINGKTLERQPEGSYNGQKMLYVGNNTYVIKVQSDLFGILFASDNGKQTFDYNEFIKLQKLGYDDITFEIKEGTSDAIASAISSAYATNGNISYSNETLSSDIQSTFTSNVDSEFKLDTNIEGYVIDVFGNKLLVNGNPIKPEDLEGETTSAKLSDLISKLGLSDESVNAIYGARYGDGAKDSSYYAPNGYGMEYPIRVYYFDNNFKLITQQLSGYGPIEGAAYENGKSNIESGLIDWSYYEGTNASQTEKSFVDDGNVLSASYAGLPYLVSYKKEVNNRVAGKWYYQRDIAQFDVSVAVAYKDADGNISLNDTVGTATVNGETSVTVNQGDMPTFEAAAKDGYRFVGFYSENASELYSTNNPMNTHAVTAHETVWAVFEKIPAGTLIVENRLYAGQGLDPVPGGGHGTLSVILYVSTDGGVTYTAHTDGKATIEDGDYFYYVLSAKPAGADTFIAFRQKETDVDGNVKYVTLDTLDNQTVESDGTYTFTSIPKEWKWDIDSSSGYVITRYTDLQKVDVTATLNYHYTDRFGKDKLYVVKVNLSDDEIADSYKPSQATIEKYAPYIGDLFKDCEWQIQNTEKTSITSSRAEIYAVHVNTNYTTIVIDKSANKNVINSLYNETVQLTTDSNGFSYWMQYDLDEDLNKIESSGIIFSYSNTVTIRTTFNRMFVAVYEGAVEDKFVTNIQAPVYTREQSTNEDGTVKYDYVYTDFLAQFETSISGKTFADVVKNGANGVTNVRFGLITERDIAAAAYAGGTLTGPSGSDAEFVKNNIIALYEKIDDTNKIASDWSNETDKEQETYNYYYSLYDLTDSVDNLTMLGRIDYYFKAVNSEANQGKVYNVYSYVIYDDADGTHVVLSAPRVMNIYEAGTATPTVTE